MRKTVGSKRKIWPSYRQGERARALSLRLFYETLLATNSYRYLLHVPYSHSRLSCSHTELLTPPEPSFTTMNCFLLLFLSILLLSLSFSFSFFKYPPHNTTSSNNPPPHTSPSLLNYLNHSLNHHALKIRNFICPITHTHTRTRTRTRTHTHTHTNTHYPLPRPTTQPNLTLSPLPSQ